MATPITYTVGKTGRDYASLNLWEADIGVGISNDLVTDDEVWTIECYNDDGTDIVESGSIVTQPTTDATRYITIKPATGSGAGGTYPNDHTTRGTSAALIDNPALGVCFNYTGTFSFFIDWSGGGGGVVCYLKNLQFYMSGNRGGGPRIYGQSGAGGGVENCISRCEHNQSNHALDVKYLVDDDTWANIYIFNNLCIVGDNNRDGIALGYKAYAVVNCTVWNSEGGGTSIGFFDESGTDQCMVYNCCAFNCFLGFDATDADCDYNCGDDAVPSTGANSFQTTGGASAQFVNPVNSRSGDFRLKSGNELEGAGGSGYVPAADIRGVSFGSPPAIGAVEAVSASVSITVPKGALALTGYAPTVTATANVSVSIPKGSLSLTGYAPAAAVTANFAVEIPKGSLALTGYAPTVSASSGLLVQIPKGSLSLTGYAPTVTATAHVEVQVPKGSLALTGYAPAVAVTANFEIQIPKGSLALTGYAPTVSASSGIQVNIPKGSLALTGYAPTVTATAHVEIPVPKGSLSLTGYEPAVSATANFAVEIPKGSLALTGYAPTVSASSGLQVNIPKGSLSLTGYAPTVAVTENFEVQVPKGALALTGYAPTVTATAHIEVQIPKGSLALTGYAPTVSATAGLQVNIPKGSLSLTGYAPAVTATAHVEVQVPKGALALTGYAPAVTATAHVDVQVPKGALALTGYAPRVYLSSDVSVVAAISVNGRFDTAADISGRHDTSASLDGRHDTSIPLDGHLEN